EQMDDERRRPQRQPPQKRRRFEPFEADGKDSRDVQAGRQHSIESSFFTDFLTRCEFAGIRATLHFTAGGLGWILPTSPPKLTKTSPKSICSTRSTRPRADRNGRKNRRFRSIRQGV